jgi:hypothetical protein
MLSYLYASTPNLRIMREQGSQRACHQRWRALLLAIKAKLESVEAVIETFDEVLRQAEGRRRAAAGYFTAVPGVTSRSDIDLGPDCCVVGCRLGGFG